jgi:apolipoprotein N-acyltransferase
MYNSLPTRQHFSSMEDKSIPPYEFIPFPVAKWLYGALYLLAAMIFGALGNSLEPVAMAAWLQPFFLILGIEAFEMETISSAASVASFVGLTQGLAFCFGFWSMNGYPSNTSMTVFQTFLMGFALWFAYCIFAIFPQYFYRRRYPSSSLAIFVFPVSHCVISIVVVGNSLSTFVSIANAVLDLEPLRQIASLVGLCGVEFYLILSATIASYSLLQYFPPRSQVFKYFFLSSVTIFLLTGFLAQRSALYQKNVSAQVVPLIPASCVFGQCEKPGSDGYAGVWENTALRVADGDAFVLWAEETVQISTSKEEQDLISRAANLTLLSPGAGAYIGLAYLKTPTHSAMSTNHFTLISPEGKVAWNYEKSHPVPGVEDEVKAGPSVLPTHDSPYGLLGGAICFDLDFPNFIRQAGQKGVDILLQPSWTWNAISSRHFVGDAVRSVENGFTLVRCSSDGESGVVGPTGIFTSRFFTGHDPRTVVSFSIPQRDRVDTMYNSFGFLFEWCLLPAMAYFLLYAYSPFLPPVGGN